MNRFVVLLVFLSVLVISSRPAGPAAAGPAPNFVVIMTDDQRVDTLSLMDNVQTMLADEGVTFHNAFAPTPRCCPSRASFLTGQYAHTHGVLSNFAPLGGATLFDDTTTVATLLQANGYRTGLLGKYLNDYDLLLENSGYPYVPPGWDRWLAFVEKFDGQDGPNGYYYDYSLNDNGVLETRGADADDYSTDLLTAEALTYIAQSAGAPFFLLVSYWAPHTVAVPADRHAGALADLSPPPPPNFNESDMTDKPSFMQQLLPVDPERMLQIYRAQGETLLAVDEGVGQIMAALEAEGILNNTYVVFVSDNSMMLGEHRWRGKGLPYEESIRIPFIVRPPAAPWLPITRDELVLNIDLLPTILDLAGISAPSDVFTIDGRSLMEIGLPDWREEMVLESWGVLPFTGVRTATSKYVEYDNGEMELYDLQADPYELNNLAGDPAHDAELRRMQARLTQQR